MILGDGRRRRIARLHRRKTRRREGLVLVEGPRAVHAALDAGMEPRFAVVSPRLGELDPLLADRLQQAGEVVRVSDEEMASLADTEAPQGVLAVFEEPPDVWVGGIGPEARLLILDGVQDPGNVGTLIRSAAAFALDGIVLLDGTADAWGPKAVRASAGAGFSCPLAQRHGEEVLVGIASARLPLWIADADGTPVARLDPARGGGSVSRGEPVPSGEPVSSGEPIVGVEPAYGRGWGAGWALVIGSEGRGVRDSVRAASSGALSIPMPGGTESLNAGVAGSILLYELTRSDGGHGA